MGEIQHVAWCRYVTASGKATRIVLCDSDAEDAFPVFRHPHGKECQDDRYSRDVCEGMYADKCDDVIGLSNSLRAVLAIAGESKEVREIVESALLEFGGLGS